MVMRRQAIGVAVVFLLALCSFIPAGRADGAEPPPAGNEVEQSAQKVRSLFGDISKNMETIEKMLNRKQSDAACKEKQNNVVSQLDELIEQLKNLQQSSSSSSGGGGQQKQGGKQKQSSGDQKAEKQQRKIEEQKGRKPGDEKQKGGKKETSGKTEEEQNKVEGEPPEGTKGAAGSEKKRPGGWGFLPGEIRALYRSHGRDGLPARYMEVIRRYFERLSKETNR